MFSKTRILLASKLISRKEAPKVAKRSIFGKIFGKNEETTNTAQSAPIKQSTPSHQTPFAASSATSTMTGADPAPTINTNRRPGTGHMAQRQPIQSKSNIPGVKNIIAVASGKGGVGKSTVSVNLALAFERLGKRVGLLDADIYGPSIPLMMNLRHQQPEMLPDNFMKPLTNYNLKCISSGFLVPEDTAYVWRGPMIMGAVQQLLFQVQWGELDVLVLDLPPGTGDTQLTVTQRVALSGAVIVSTPQDVALADARRGITMFKNVNVPILGVVENMSGFICPKCSEVHDIFGKGGAKQTALSMGIDFLGEIPLDPSIRDTTDRGTPIVVSHPDSYSAQLYIDMARKLLEKIEKGDKSTQSPNIVFEESDYSRVWTIYEMLHPKPEDLINPDRFFIREGELLVWDEKTKQRKKRHFFLFNDVLLLTKKEGSRKYWLRIYISLRSPHVNIDDGGDSPYNSEFRLNCRSRSFLFFAPTPDVKEQWVREMRQSVTGGHDKVVKEVKKKEIEKQAEKIKVEPLRPLKKVIDEEESRAVPLLAPPPKTGSSTGLGFGIAPPPQSKNSLQVNIKPAAPANNQGIPDFIDFGSQKSVQTSTSPTNPFLQPQTSAPMLGFPQQPQQSMMMGQQGMGQQGMGQQGMGSNNPFGAPSPQPMYGQQQPQQPMYSQPMGMQPLQMTYPQSPTQPQQPNMNMGYMQPTQPQQPSAPFNPFATPTSPSQPQQPIGNQPFNPFLSSTTPAPSMGNMASPTKPASHNDDPFADLFVSVGSNQPQGNQSFQQPPKNNKADTFDFLM